MTKNWKDIFTNIFNKCETKQLIIQNFVTVHPVVWQDKCYAEIKQSFTLIFPKQNCNFDRNFTEIKCCLNLNYCGPCDLVCSKMSFVILKLCVKNAELVSTSINCNWFTCRHLCGLWLWKVDALASFNRRRMKAESRQIPQKLAARLVCLLYYTVINKLELPDPPLRQLFLRFYSFHPTWKIFHSLFRFFEKLSYTNK